jgi:hypothetical protein
MKNLTNLLISLAIASILLATIGCETDNIKSGIETRVYGKLTDFYNTPVVNEKVLIGEYKGTFNMNNGGGQYLQKWIDSTYTNALGEYDITFKTSGEGTSYKLKMDDSPAILQKYWVSLPSVEIKNLGSSFNYSTNAILIVYPCNITFKPNNILIFPLRVSAETTLYDTTFEIRSNAQTTKTIFIDKYTPQNVYITRTKANGSYQRAVFTFPASNVETLTTPNITITEADFNDIKK